MKLLCLNCSQNYEIIQSNHTTGLKKKNKKILENDKKSEDKLENLQKNLDKLENFLRNIRMKTDYFLEDLKKIDQIKEENFISSSEIIQNIIYFLNDPLYCNISDTAKIEERKNSDKIKMNEFEINDFMETHSSIFSICPNKNFLFDIFHPKNIVGISLLYKGSENYFSSKIFHKRCDNKKSTLTLIFSEKEKVFGGYSSIYFESNKEAKFDENSFIFSFDERMKFLLNQENKDNFYIVNESLGPYFGDDLAISDACNINKYSSSQIGCNYNLTIMPIKYQSKESFSILAGEKNFKVLEYEVYQIYLNR